REGGLEKSVRFGVRYRFMNQLPGFLKLQQFSGNCFREVAHRKIRIGYFSVEDACVPEHPLERAAMLRERFGCWFLLDDLLALPLQKSITGANPLPDILVS